MAAPGLRRRIRFVAWEGVPEPADFDLAAATAGVSGLGDADWRLDRDELITAAIVDRPGGNGLPTCMRYFRLREGDDLPHKLDAQRATTPVEVGEGEAITDWTQVVIWPDGYAAHDPRRDAPTLMRLTQYLRHKTDQRLRFLPLFDRNLIEQLRALDDLRAVELRISKPDALQEIDDQRLGMFGGIFNMARETDTATLATTLSVGRSRTRHLTPAIKDDVVALAEIATEFLDHLVVRGVEGGRGVTIDLLNQRIEGYHTIRRAAPNVRVPDLNAMYDAIIAMRRTLDDDGGLDAAARGRLG